MERKSAPEAWANESHRVVVETVYRDVPADGPPPTLRGVSRATVHNHIERLQHRTLEVNTRGELLAKARPQFTYRPKLIPDEPRNELSADVAMANAEC